MPTYYQKQSGSFGVNVHFYSAIPTFDHLGTLKSWNDRIHQIAGRMTQAAFDIVLRGLDIHIVDMDCDKLDLEVAQGQANLQNLKPGTFPQISSSGLYWRGKRKLELAVFHDGWTADVQPSAKPIQPHNVLSAQDTLSHEIGHHIAHLIEYQANQTFAGKEITARLWPYLQSLVDSKQCSNLDEAFAEVWRAVCGDDRARGSFSDRKPCYPPESIKLLMQICVPLFERLKTKIIDGFRVTNDAATWTEKAYVTRFFLFLPWFPYPSLETTGEYRMGADGVAVKI